MSLSIAASQGILNQCIRGVSFSPGTPHAALAANGGNEVSGTGYARQPLTFGAATDANPSVSVTSAVADFGTWGADWTPTTIDETRVYSALTNGTILFSDTDTSESYASGDQASVASGISASFASNAEFVSSYAQSILEWLLRSGSTPARARYIGLLNSGVELSGGNYARLDTDGLFAAPTSADPSVLGSDVFACNFQFGCDVYRRGKSGRIL